MTDYPNDNIAAHVATGRAATEVLMRATGGSTPGIEAEVRSKSKRVAAELRDDAQADGYDVTDPNFWSAALWGFSSLTNIVSEAKDAAEALGGPQFAALMENVATAHVLHSVFTELLPVTPREAAVGPNAEFIAHISEGVPDTSAEAVLNALREQVERAQRRQAGGTN